MRNKQQLCKRCQGPTEQLMQQASPFYTCMVETCANYLPVASAAQEAKPEPSAVMILRGAMAVAKMESWTWGSSNTPNGNTVKEQKAHCLAMSRAVLCATLNDKGA